MLDLKQIRREPEIVKAALSRRDPALAEEVDVVLGLDKVWRDATSEAESERHAQRAQSETTNNLREMLRAHSANLAAGAQPEEDATPEHGKVADMQDRLDTLMAQLKQTSVRVKTLGEQAAHAAEELQDRLARLPNLPDPTAADGPEDELVRTVGEPRELGFPARDHLELAGPRIDMDAGAKLSGTRFAYLKGELVRLELALVSYAIDTLSTHGFTPVIPPVLVRERALYGTGFLPDTEQQIYRLADDDLYLIGTSEVALASLHDGEVIEPQRLPLRYAGYSPCFRREAGAAGKDTRGIFRVHQFEKVEMLSFVAPKDSAAEHERILGIEEQILTELAIPYRVVNIAVGDLGSSAAKKYDCEAWLPSQERYRELTSCSNTTDYQARRLSIRTRRDDGPGRGQTEPVHTLNGTAVAVGRTMIALLENGQQEDGSVLLPERLVSHGAPRQLAPAA